MDITTQADRAGRADHFGDLYDASQLKAVNMAELGLPAEEAKGPALQRTATVRACSADLGCLLRLIPHRIELCFSSLSVSSQN